MFNKSVFKLFLYVFFIITLFNCSTVEEDEPPILIEDLKVSKVENKVPRDNYYQCDLELTAVMGEKNREQDIEYKWLVEDMKMDIFLESDDNLERTTDLILRNYKRDVYFIDVSNNPLVSILSVYTPGYYKLTLIASNINETKYRTVVIKVGEPESRDLYFKLNIPSQGFEDNIDLKSDIYKGKFYYTLYNRRDKIKLTDENIFEVNAKDMSGDWYNTGV